MLQLTEPWNTAETRRRLRSSDSDTLGRYNRPLDVDGTRATMRVAENPRDRKIVCRQDLLG